MLDLIPYEKPCISSYNRLGRNADESDAEAIIDMAGKASLADQQKQVQENIHSQIKTFCASMDEILLPDSKSINESSDSTSQRNTAVPRSGLGLAVGRMSPQNKSPGEYLSASLFQTVRNLFLSTPGHFKFHFISVWNYYSFLLYLS